MILSAIGWHSLSIVLASYIPLYKHPRLRQRSPSQRVIFLQRLLQFSLKAKIHYTSLPVASPQQVGSLGALFYSSVNCTGAPKYPYEDIWCSAPVQFTDE